MVRIYGIPNCDTMKKARKWLDSHDIEYDFHDYKKKGIDAALLDSWLKKTDWKILLNRRGMMWRKLSDEQKQNIDAASARDIMLETPSIIKRPVMDYQGKITVGFKEDIFQQILGQ